MQVVAIPLALAATAVGVALVARAVGEIVAGIRIGQPTSSSDPRANDPLRRTRTLLREFLGHTRMARKPVVAVAHWVTMVAFGVLFLSLITAYGQLFDPGFVLPVVGHWVPLEWLGEGIAWLSLAGILVLMAVRQREHPRRSGGDRGRRSRFFGSTWWQAYYVELTILGVVVCVLALRALEYARGRELDATWATAWHFPTTAWLGGLVDGASAGALGSAIIAVATGKILISMAWFVTIGLRPTMGVAWHRFLAFVNIWTKRNADGRTALGELRPISVDGKPVDFADVDGLDEDAALGVGKVEQFTWKGLLDVSTCTECGRCQSQCPAWHTDKPLSPKLLVMSLRDHAHAVAPHLRAAGSNQGADAAGGGSGRDATTGGASPAVLERARLAHERPLVAATGWADPDSGTTDAAGSSGDPGRHSAAGSGDGTAAIGVPDGTAGLAADPRGAYRPGGGEELGGLGVIDPEVLWSCTSCGACVEQCPVDIEHVDHIIDMRRYQVLMESAFPTELGGLFKNLENAQNPWGMNARMRLDWAKDLPFEIKQVGRDVESLAEVEYLFWVGCAGAFEDRAKKTTRAVAELLHTAGVEFAVLGDGESCTGDPARRAGNEFVFQMLAQANVEVLGEAGATKIVVTCPHCLNTLSREYPQLGGRYEVVHHTQLLNQLVRAGRLVPIAPVSGAPLPRTGSTAPSDQTSGSGDVGSTTLADGDDGATSRSANEPGTSIAASASVTYHDPCYLGRHNGVYNPPRELIGALPGVEYRELPRSRERSFCCGAGGARMWMEERIGTRINADRTAEAVATGADRIAVGCPFCRVMLSDGLASAQGAGEARDQVQVVDVAQLLLAAVQRGPGSGSTGAGSGE
ncbi:MAG: (Fe-S)-binding protein [Angustibacter sp.]